MYGWRLGVLSLGFAVAACSGGELRESASSQGFVRGADDHRFFYRILGSGSDTVVVVHGFQGNNQSYLASDVAEVIPGYALLFYDQRGGGRSDPVSEEDSPGIEEHVANLEGAYDYLMTQTENAYLGVSADRRFSSAPGSSGERAYTSERR